jgi:Rieske Fe-S protein
MIDRRSIVKSITALPLLAVAGAVGTALLSYLKPTWKPLALPATEKPLNKDLIAASLSEFPKEYDFKAFTFTQITVEYSARGTQATDILGFLVRVPNDQMNPAEVGAGLSNNLRRGYAEAEFNGQKYSMVAVSRICAHLGCIFEYKEPADVCTGFNYCAAKNPHFACPCHLSVYNPVQDQAVPGFGKLPGRVVSGPAPRTPFPFDFVIENGNIVIKNYG